MSGKLESVWLVGGKRGSTFADVYACEEHATKAVMGYIFDPHWFNKLADRHQKMLLKLKDDPELAIQLYNDASLEADKWLITEQKVKYAP